MTLIVAVFFHFYIYHLTTMLTLLNAIDISLSSCVFM